MKKIMKTCLMLSAALFVANATAYCQSSYKIAASSENKMQLAGTSTFHDWEMIAKTFTGNAQFNLAGAAIKELKSLNFSLPVTQLKSDKSALNKNAYKALKTAAFANIVYKLKSAKVIGEKAALYQISTIGNLTIAGVTKEVAIEIYCLANKNSSITCKGSYKIKMTDYNVKPPKFMGGVMTTGDDTTLDFTMIFTK